MCIFIAIIMWIKMRIIMKTIQMTLDEKLLNKVDQEAKVHHKTRSAFIRDSIEFYLKQAAISEMEKQHLEGYLKHPVKKGEFDIWEDEQIWES